MITDYSAAVRYKDGSKISTRLTIGPGTSSVVINDEDFVEDGCVIQEDLIGSGVNYLRFGECASCGFTAAFVYTGDSLVGKSVTLEHFPADHSDEDHLQVGVYKIISDEIDENDSKVHTITAYDALYEMHNTDVSAWWDALWESGSTVTFKSIRDGLASKFGIAQVAQTLVNDGEVIATKPFDGKVSAGQILKWVFELNGVFGHITRDGLATTIRLRSSSGLVPHVGLVPHIGLRPFGGNNPKEKIRYEYEGGSLKYANYKTANITRVQLRTNDADIGAVVGTAGNDYIIEGNPLLYGMGATQLERIAAALLSVISEVSYTPYSVTAMGNPCVEVGDTVQMWHSDGAVEGYVLNRTLRGIQALTDDYSADGEEYYSDEVNGISYELRQLESKTMEVRKSVDGLSVVVGDSSSGLVHDVSITAGALASEITRATSAESSLSSYISQTASEVSAKVSQTGGYSSSFAWSLLSNKFKLISNNQDVFVCDANGVDIYGRLKSHSNNTICEIGEYGLTVENPNATGEPSAAVGPTGIFFFRDINGSRTLGQIYFAIDGELKITPPFGKKLTLHDWDTDPLGSDGIVLTSTNWSQYIPNGNGVSY